MAKPLQSSLAQFIRGWTAFLMLAGTAAAWAQPEALPEGDNAGAVRQLVATLAQTRSLRAQVEQLMLDQEGRELQETQGQLLMRKPAHFYWETEQPFEQVMVTDGERVWNYEPDLFQVTIQAFDGEVSRTPVLLLSGDEASIGEAFQVSLITQPGNARQRYILHPRQSGSLYQRLSLTFFEQVIEEMQFEDSLGQKTSLSFIDVEVNLDLPDSHFQFTIPDGIDVIDGT